MHLVVFESVFFCLFRMRRARHALAAEAADEDEQSFQDEVLFLHLDVEVEAGLE